MSEQYEMPPWNVKKSSEVSERMTDERLAEVSSFKWRLWNKYDWRTLYVEMVDALKAEREAATFNMNHAIELNDRIAELEGKTVNGIVPEKWPPNRRTPDDSNEKAVALMRQHVASYISIDAHRHNCLDLCCRLEDQEEENQRLKAALVKANNNQMAAAQCASDFKYGYEKRGKEIEELEAKLDAVRDMSSIVLKLLQENPWPTSDTRWQTVEEMAKTNLKALGEAK